jgi:acyl-CoA synthetase (NDP forming)
MTTRVISREIAPKEAQEVASGKARAVSSRIDLKPLLRPRSVAVIGASANSQSWGGAILANLQAMGFQGRIYPINPNHQELSGLTCYPDVESVPDEVDAALLFVPKSAIAEVLEQCGRKGVQGAVILAAGFSETGDEGRQLEQDLRAVATRHGIAVCGPNCMGLVNLADGFTGYTAATLPPVMTPGRTALVSQSGQLASVIFVRSHDQGVHLRYLVSTGNEMVVEASDYALFMLEDPDVASIGLVLEGLRDPAKFLVLAERAGEAGKPLIVLKLGRSKAAARTALAHTGKMAGSSRTYDAVFRQNNIVAVDSPLEIADVAALFEKCPAPKGRRVSFVTFSGGWCGVVADQMEAIGLPLAEFTEKTVEMLEPLLDFTPPVNPLDLSGHISAHPERWGQSLQAVLEDENTDILVVFVHQVRAAWRDRFIEPVIEVARNATKPVLVVHDGGKVVEAGYERLADDGTLPIYRDTRPMLKALRRFTDYHMRRAEMCSVPAVRAEASPDAAAEARRHLGAWHSVLPEHIAKSVLRAYGLPVTDECIVTSAEEATRQAEKLGYPVVLKGLADGMEHKTEAGLVRLGLGSPGGVAAAFDDMMKTLSGKRLGGGQVCCLLQPMHAAGVEAILGLQRDPDFGPMVL